MARDNVKFDTPDPNAAKDGEDAHVKGNAGDRVTVMCKLPHGVILRGFKMVASRELVMGGGSREINVAQFTGESCKIYGVAAEFGRPTRAVVTPSGYAITANVPKDLWDNWLAANKDSPMVRNRLIYAELDRSRAVAASKELFETRSGLEQLDPVKDARAPRKSASLDAISPSDEMQERFRKMEDHEAVANS